VTGKLAGKLALGRSQRLTKPMERHWRCAALIFCVN